MVNLRYHIVSLIAVFLALALGIVVGSTVIDRALVDTLNDRVDAVEARANSTAAENRRLEEEIRRLEDFAEQARDAVVDGRLDGVPVLVITVDGVDNNPTERLDGTLRTASAVPAGTLSFSTRLLLGDDADVRALSTVLRIPGSVPGGLRQLAIDRVAAVLRGSAPDPDLLPALAAEGFVRYDPPRPVGAAPTAPTSVPRTLGLASFPVAGLRVVVVSGPGAQVPDAILARPLVVALARADAGLPAVVAAQATAHPEATDSFLAPLRSDGSLAPGLSTVDNLDTPVGQAATVLALRDLKSARTGHYGVGPGAQRQLPAGA